MTRQSLREAMLVNALRDTLDILRAIIDQGALKNVAHLRDGGDVLREDAHEAIQRARAAMAACEER